VPSPLTENDPPHHPDIPGPPGLLLCRTVTFVVSMVAMCSSGFTSAVPLSVNPARSLTFCSASRY
jgi:hypothetical protein